MRLEVMRGLESVREERLKEIRLKYDSVCNGVDPETGKDIYVDCVAGTISPRMNAGANAAGRMDGGVRIFERQGASHMVKVRDFHNHDHLNVPMADAISISVQQGADALNHWVQKGALVDAVEAIKAEDYASEAEAIAALRAIPIVFNVNVE